MYLLCCHVLFNGGSLFCYTLSKDHTGFSRYSKTVTLQKKVLVDVRNHPVCMYVHLSVFL